MIIDTTRFGKVELEENKIISLPRGLIGFEDAQAFCIIQNRSNDTFKWLQCVTKPSLAFIVADPFDFYEDYEIQLSRIEAEYLEILRGEDAMALALVTADSETSEITMNLAGPVIVNSITQKGMQIVLDDERYGARHPLVHRKRKGHMDERARAA